VTARPDPAASRGLRSRLVAIVAACLLAWLAALPLAGAVRAQPAAPDAPLSPREEQWLRTERFRHLAGELRCLVCQNQTLADSNSGLAGDLRNEVLRQMAAGRSDEEIKEHLVARYGEFVLYRPAFSARNVALWAGPFLLLALGAGVLWRMTRRRAAPPAASRLSDADASRIERLLDGESPPR
jgi:cytochrome c-type biogenesis protein CcmH